MIQNDKFFENNIIKYFTETKPENKANKLSKVSPIFRLYKR